MFYQDKNVLVTGGTGLVGTHIVQDLLKQGARVRVPIHRRPPTIQDGRIEFIHADLTGEEDCLAAVKGIDYVFHAAGAVGSASTSPAQLMGAIATDLVLGARMLHAAWAEGVDRFLLVSSSTVYPPADYPVKEEEAWSGEMYPSYAGYGWMKKCLEKLAEYVASQSGMRIAIIRATALYGPWDDFDPATSHVVPALIRKAVRKEDPYEVWGSGEEIRDLLHINDLARACRMALEKYATCDPLNIGYGKAVAIKELTRMVLKAANHEDTKVQFNTSKPSAVPIRMVDISKAKEVMGFEPQISLEEGLKDTVNWYANTRAT